MFRRATGYLWTLGFTALIIAITVNIIDRKFFSGPSSARQAVQQQAEQRRQALEEEREAGLAVTEREAQQLLDDAERRLDQALTHIENWQREIDPLQTGAAGRAITEDEKLTDQMAYLFAAERPTAEALAGTRERIAQHREHLQAAAAGSDAEFIAIADRELVRELHAEASEAEQAWREAIDRAGAIVRDAERRANGDSPPGDRSLADSMQAVKDRQALESLEEQRARERQIAAGAAEKLAERQRLEEESQSPEVQSALAPFLAPRRLQPRLSGSSIVMEKSFESQPMSLSRLEQIGALEPTLDGLKMLARVGGDRKLPQPRWSFPTEPGNWTPENEAVLQKAQDLLRTHGTTLVRLGQLSP